MALSVTSGPSAQSTTQDPQASAGADSSTLPTGNVQPGTATSLLNGQGSVALHTTPLSTVDLNSSGGAQTSTQAVAAPVITHHHTNPVLLGGAGVLIVIALVACWLIPRSVKSTTLS